MQAQARRSPAAVAALTLIGVGCGVRLWQYFADTSLWYDELFIARNIHERSLTDLIVRPLGYDQVAPVGLILLLKVGTMLAGDSDLVLRWFPLVCGLVALVLFWRLAERTLDDPEALIAIGLFAIAIPLVRYSTEVKQYSTDTAVAVGLTLLAVPLCLAPVTIRRAVVVGLAGWLAIVFSEAAVLAMVGLAGALVASWLMKRDAKALRPALITVSMWALACIVGLVGARRYTTPDTLLWMHGYWGRQGGFFPRGAGAGADVLWVWVRIYQFFADEWMLRYPWPALYAVLTIVGLVLLWRRDRPIALLILGPLIVTLGAAVAGQYPFSGRVALFLLPDILLALAIAIAAIAATAARWQRSAGMVALAAMLAPAVSATVLLPPPYVIEGFKPMLAYLSVHREPGDRVYVHPNAFEAVDRYGPRFGLPPGTYVVGVCNDHDLRAYVEDVDRFRGVPRLWVIGSSVRPYLKPRQVVERYLGTIGTRRASFAVAPPLMRAGADTVSALLFDLSDPTRLQSTTAATFDVGPMPEVRPGCRDRVRPTTQVFRDPANLRKE